MTEMHLYSLARNALSVMQGGLSRVQLPPSQRSQPGISPSLASCGLENEIQKEQLSSGLVCRLE